MFRRKQFDSSRIPVCKSTYGVNNAFLHPKTQNSKLSFCLALCPVGRPGKPGSRFARKQKLESRFRENITVGNQKMDGFEELDQFQKEFDLEQLLLSREDDYTVKRLSMETILIQIAFRNS